MKYITAQMVLDKVHELKTIEELLSYYIKAKFNIESTMIMIEKWKEDAIKSKESASLLLSTIRQSHKDLIKALRNIALTFSDTEEDVFIEYFINNKTSKKIAEELDLNETYIRQILGRLKQNIETQFNDEELIKKLGFKKEKKVCKKDIS